MNARQRFLSNAATFRLLLKTSTKKNIDEKENITKKHVCIDQFLKEVDQKKMEKKEKQSNIDVRFSKEQLLDFIFLFLNNLF